MADTEKIKLPDGYMGKVLKVDLTSLKSQTEPLDFRLAEFFFGGRGLGVVLLFKHFLDIQQQGKYRNAFAEVDPLSDDNVIIIATSPCTGTRVPGSSRMHMNFKSPLTGIYGSTNTGGKWAVEFKRAGYDAMIISGKAESPTYLLITNNEVKFCDAGDICRLDAIEKRQYLQQKLGAGTQVLTIGKAGRNMVRFAAVMSDTGKAFGRCGGGAVWGAKNLHAIAVLAETDVNLNVADIESFDPKNPEGAMYHARLKLDLGKFTKRENAFGILSSMGSLGIMGMVHSYGQLIRHNMKDTYHKLEDVNEICGEALRNHAKNAKQGQKKILVKKGACYNCSIACKRNTTLLDEEGRLIEKGEGPEFENTTMLGANLEIYDLPTIVQANYLANRYGLDAISTGATIAAFFELYEYITSKKEPLGSSEQKFLNDIRDFVNKYGEPQFGRPEILIPLIHLIGNLEGIGKYLAEGSYLLCRRYGHMEFSMTIKRWNCLRTTLAPLSRKL